MSRVSIRCIRPEGLHGFKRGQLVLEGLDDKINVVYAPNATGKSTLGKAIGLALNPRQIGDALIGATVACDGAEEERIVRRKSDPYPGAPDRPEDYLLDIVRLLEGLSASEASVLNKQVGGGLSVDPGALPQTANLGVLRAASEARAQLKGAREKGVAAANDEERLPNLERQLADSEKAARQAESLRQWLQRRESEEREGELARQLRALVERHPGIERQSEGALATALALKKALDGAEQAADSARSDLSRSHPEGTSPERTITDGERAELEAAIQALRDARIALREAERTRTARAGELAELRSALLNLVSEEELEGLAAASSADFQALAQAADAADAHREAVGRRDGFVRARDRLREQAGQADASLDEKIAALRQWLEAEPTATRDDRATYLLVVAAAGAVGVSVSPDIVVRLIVALLAIAAAAAVFMLRKPVAGEDRRSGLAERAGLSPETDVAVAVQRLAELDAKRAQLEVARQLELLADEKVPDLNWPEVAARLRLVADDPYRLAAVARAVERYLQQAGREASDRAAVKEARERVATAGERVRQSFAPFDFPCNEDSPETAKDAFYAWFDRASDLTKATATAEARRRDMRCHLDRMGIPALETVESGLQELESRDPVATEWRQLTADLEAARQALAKAPADPAGIREIVGGEPDLMLREEIEARVNQLTEAASERDQILSEIASVKERIRGVEQDAAVARAQEGYERAMAQVETKWHDCVREAVRFRLKSHLSERLRTVDLPDTVKHADRWVTRFTAGRYRLALERPGAKSKEKPLGSLCAYDTITGREFGFDQLSTGTRVHIVLALRLGLLERHEEQANGGTRRFPLVADEVMAVSDPDASRALAEALVEISESRQVIVFTNQPDDVRVFQSLVPGLVGKTITSDAIPIPVETEEEPLVTYRPPAGPRRLDLRVPIRAHAAEALLPSHAVRSQEAATVVEVGEAGFLDALEALRQELIRDYPRLHWDAIHAQDWTDNAFRGDIREAAEKSDGDGKRFFEMVRQLPRFRDVTRQQARDWLEAEGYLSEPPDEAEIRRRAHLFFGQESDPYRVEHAIRLVHQAFWP